MWLVFHWWLVSCQSLCCVIVMLRLTLSLLYFHRQGERQTQRKGKRRRRKRRRKCSQQKNNVLQPSCFLTSATASSSLSPQIQIALIPIQPLQPQTGAGLRQHRGHSWSRGHQADPQKFPGPERFSQFGPGEEVGRRGHGAWRAQRPDQISSIPDVGPALHGQGQAAPGAE